jgi:hypothetical protein
MEQVWQMLLNSGTSELNIQLIQHSYVVLVMIPVVTTILALLRYIIGIKSPNVVSVLLLTFMFLQVSFNPLERSEDFISGLKYGTIFYLLVLITTLTTYAIIKKFRMHYIPKLTIVFTSVVLVFITSIIVTQANNTASLIVNQTFVLVIIAVLAENIVTSFAVKNFNYALDLGIRTYIISLLCFIIIANPEIRYIFTEYPYLIALLLVMNIYIGKFKGLRLTEYFRFKSILLSEHKEDGQTKSNSKK